MSQGVECYSCLPKTAWPPTWHNLLVGDALNLLEVSDGWGHLKFGTNWDGNQHAYDGTVDVAKVDAGKA